MTSPQPDSQSNQPITDAELSVDEDVMEKVLQETLSAADSDEPIGKAELEVLLSVARRHAGQQLSLEPITVELVESILLQRFGEPLQASKHWKGMPRDVAGTLWEGPDSHDRLERLWNRLAEVIR